MAVSFIQKLSQEASAGLDSRETSARHQLSREASAQSHGKYLQVTGSQRKQSYLQVCNTVHGHFLLKAEVSQGSAGPAAMGGGRLDLPLRLDFPYGSPDLRTRGRVRHVGGRGLDLCPSPTKVA